MPLLGLVVTHIDLGSEFHLLDFDPGLVLLRLLGFHGLVILVLAIVHDAADRRLGIRCNLHQVIPLLFSDIQGALDREDPQLLALDADEADLVGPDLIVEPVKQ